MPLETATYISDLVTSNPAASDGMNNADDHMRLTKAAVKNTFPGATGPLTTATGGHQAQTDGTSTAPAFTFASEATLGFYRESAGVIRVAGGTLRGAGDVGEVKTFLAEPVGLGKGGVGTGHLYLELDGSTWNTADFPRLAAHLGISASTFTLINPKSTGAFFRSRTATTPVLTYQTNQNKSHFHGISLNTSNEGANHTHNFAGATSGMNRNNPHTHSSNGVAFSNNAVTGASNFALPQYQNGLTINPADIDHEHAFSGVTGVENQVHAHSVNGNTGTGSADGTEARPENFSVIFCIKT